MPATLRLREQDQTAELHELLSRLQTHEVDCKFGGILDVRRNTNSLRGITRANILKICEKLSKEQDTSAAKLPVDTKTTLLEFMELLGIKYNENDKKAYMTKVGVKWKILDAELTAYSKSPRHAALEAAISNSYINDIKTQMNAYKQGWTNEFK
jgi:hypothetical protein